jgi:hypothetical protein
MTGVFAIIIKIFLLSYNLYLYYNITMAPKGTPMRHRGKNCTWTNKEIDQLIEQLQEAKSLGQTSENGFKSSVWNQIAASFTDPLKTEKRTCESKWARLKKDYKEVKFLRELSGFGWNDETGLLTAEPQVWSEVAKVSILFSSRPNKHTK